MTNSGNMPGIFVGHGQGTVLNFARNREAPPGECATAERHHPRNVPLPPALRSQRHIIILRTHFSHLYFASSALASLFFFFFFFYARVEHNPFSVFYTRVVPPPHASVGFVLPLWPTNHSMTNGSPTCTPTVGHLLLLPAP